MTLNYLDFDIEIGRGDGRTYPLAVIDSPAGNVRAKFHFTLSELELKNLWCSLQNAQTVRSFGAKLFDSLFSEHQIRSSFDISKDRATMQNKYLRVKLRILDPRMAVVPWEYLYDTSQGEYLCLGHQISLIRYLEVAKPPRSLTVKPPLRILGMIASPVDLPSLQVDVEKQRLRNALAELIEKGLVQLDWLSGQTISDLRRATRPQMGPWHAFHFVGHGGYDSQSNEGLLIFADEAGKSDSRTATEVARLLTGQPDLRFVMLNACKGSFTSETGIFTSTAATLVQQGIPAVIAMQHNITDPAAIAFSGNFYDALMTNLQIDAAVADARLGMSQANSNIQEWGVPTLFMRAPDGVFFELEEEERPEGKDLIDSIQNESPKVEIIGSKISEPRLLHSPIEFDWCEIPEGEFLMGSNDRPNEKPRHSIYLPAFYITKTPVTNAQYKQFVESKRHDTPKHWKYGTIPNGKENHPVVNISWRDAVAFCDWAGVQLPNEAQWEKASRGTNGRTHPWGNGAPTDRLCNFSSKIGDTTSIGNYPDGISAYGCLDMAGNVWEWTASQKKNYPYSSNDGREEYSSTRPRVLRGGAFDSRDHHCRCAFRITQGHIILLNNVGFRVMYPGSVKI